MGTCDVCGGYGESHRQSKNYNDLYLTILKIGQSRVSSGLSYSDLISELNKHGYDTNNGCVMLAVKYWFFNSFYHLADDGKPCNSINDLDTHSRCNFILKAEGSLTLLEHETMSKSLLLSRLAIRWAIFAVIVSLLTIGEVHDWVKSLFTNEHIPAKQEQKIEPIVRKSSPNLHDLKKLDTFSRGIPNKKSNKNTLSQ